jgi:hypothetical protein
VPDRDEEILKGHDIRSLGPSDSSDTGADMAGIAGLDSTSDRHGTGERQDVEEITSRGTSADLIPDRVVDGDQVGMGDGLDQAEEAQLGVTDEEIDETVRELMDED